MTTAQKIFAWVKIDPKKYYKHGRLYGLIGTIEGVDGLLYVAAMVEDVDAKFTNEMFKDIIRLYNKRTICLVTDVESKQKLIRRALSRYNFTFTYSDGNMYSTGGKNETI